MMGLSERRLRVRATYVANLLQAERYTAGTPQRVKLDDERDALSKYLGLIHKPIDPEQTRGKII